MFSYFAYGLGIKSDLPLPELVAGETAADVIVREGSVDHPLPERDDEGNYIRATPEEVHLFWPEEGSLLVRGGREIIVDALPGIDERVLRLSILGPALGILLHQRGYLVLHASAVRMYDKAVAFLGAAGWGKSTTAAALHARGYSLVADDILAVQFDTGSPRVFSGFPQLKLWPEAAASLGDDPESLPLLQPGLRKRNRRVTHDILREPLALGSIYVLAEDSDLEVELLPPQESFVELVRHTYTNRILASTGTIETHFRQCAGLAHSVPVYRLKRCFSLSTLPEIARLIEAHLGQAAPRATF